MPGLDVGAIMELKMFLQSFFKVRQRGSTIGREVLGGASTFVAMSYIIFVQPAVLSMCGTGGMDASAVMFATCFCSALACVVMGLLANLPIALAPAMGHNFFFALMVCGLSTAGGFNLTWPEALAANFIAGILFLVISLTGIRAVVMDAIPESLKYAIAVGIGLLITFVGLQWAGIIVGKPVTYVTLGNLSNPVTLLSLFGLAVIGVLLAFRFRGAILLGMLITAAGGYLAGKVWGDNWGYVLVAGASPGTFPDITATAGKFWGGLGLLFGGSHNIAQVALVIFTFLLLDVFDSIGTLIGLGERAGLMQDGKLPKARQAMTADAIGTISGTIVGTSTITSYIESSAGIAVGARTGLASIVTALLLLISIFAYPLVGVLGTMVELPAGQLGSHLVCRDDFLNLVQCYPAVAPVLIVIGCYMLPVVRKIDWEDFSEALPALLTILVMQLAISITDGIAWGFISYTLLKACTGKARQVPAVVYVCSVLFVLYYAFARV